MRVAVAGLGTVGSEELELWLEAGATVIGYDISPDRVSAVRRAVSATRASSCLLTDRIAEVGTAEVLVLCLPVVGPSGELPMEAFESFVSAWRRSRPVP